MDVAINRGASSGADPDALVESLIDQSRQRSARPRWLNAVLLLVCLAALAQSGFFDATRFIEGGPAMAQVASEMFPPDFSRW